MTSYGAARPAPHPCLVISDVDPHLVWGWAPRVGLRPWRSGGYGLVADVTGWWRLCGLLPVDSVVSLVVSLSRGLNLVSVHDLCK